MVPLLLLSMDTGELQRVSYVNLEPLAGSGLFGPFPVRWGTVHGGTARHGKVAPSRGITSIIAVTVNRMLYIWVSRRLSHKVSKRCNAVMAYSQSLVCEAARAGM